MTRRNGSLVTLPEYYRLDTDAPKPQWQVVSSKEVPEELGLTQYRFETPREKPQEPRTTPVDANSCWKKPGPHAGPYKARLGDGSVVTYYWYRFADQPAMLNADLMPEERELVQARVEKLHRTWTKDRDYLIRPDVGRLAELDPALILTRRPVWKSATSRSQRDKNWKAVDSRNEPHQFRYDGATESATARNRWRRYASRDRRSDQIDYSISETGRPNRPMSGWF